MKITGRYIKDCIGSSEEVERINGENRRWSRTNTSILNVDGKFYRVTWEEGLTENQDNEFEDQEAMEVKQVEKIITTKEWIPIN